MREEISELDLEKDQHRERVWNGIACCLPDVVAFGMGRNWSRGNAEQVLHHTGGCCEAQLRLVSYASPEGCSVGDAAAMGIGPYQRGSRGKESLSAKAGVPWLSRGSRPAGRYGVELEVRDAGRAGRAG